MSATRRILAASLALALVALLVAASQWPWQVHGEDEARIRLSWRTVSEPLEACREPTAEELAALPPHMRMKEICERRHAPLRLAVRLDGVAVHDAVHQPSGARGDRPLYVFEEIPVAPGAHRLQLELREEIGGIARRAPLTLDAVVQLAPREVALVTLDASGERLVVRGAER